MLRQQRRAHLTKGFTLTEAAIVLGIMGLVLGAIWTAAAAVYSNQRVGHANTQVLQILQSIRALYSTSATFPTGDQTSNLIALKAIPNEMVNGTTGTLINPWGGAITINGTGDGAGIALEYTGVPLDACIKFMSQVGGTNRDSGLTSAVASSSNESPPSTVGTPLDNNNAITVSNTHCITGLNSLQFVFGIKM